MPRKSWWARLPFGVRMTAGTSALLVLVGGGVTGVATLSGPDPENTTATAQAVAPPDLGAPRLEENPEVVSRAAAAAQPAPRRGAADPTTPPTPLAVTTTATPVRAPAATDRLSRARVADQRADRTGTRPARTSEKPAGEPRRKVVAEPVVVTRTDVETRAIPFDTQVVRDPSLPRGVRRLQAPGEPGEETLRYLVTLTDGRQTARRLLGSTVTKQPEPRVVALGSRRRPVLDPGCEHALHICLPLGRAAVCPAGGTGPAGAAVPGDPARPEETGEILIAEEDLELLDGVRLEPATLC